MTEAKRGWRCDGHEKNGGGCRCDGHGEATLLPCSYLLMAKGDLCSLVMVSVGAVELVVSDTLILLVLQHSFFWGGSLNNVLRG